MDYLDKFLHSVSYKFPKGYPDVNDDRDIKMLCEMVNGLLPKRFIEDLNEVTEEDSPNLTADILKLKKDN